jgi:hypothetical protein
MKMSSLPDADLMCVTMSDTDIVTHGKEEVPTRLPCALARLGHENQQNSSATETTTSPAEDVVVSSQNLFKFLTLPVITHKFLG